ncbi:hypothetical protein RO3G_04447 [Rhizopus delemar RA 99-880]|uniref:Uncharacterized protein n=1 Tax=Rhizopus delemar (strain RA 99-880 / ATCC MYA-4621 / FGSC 9543 / NRRL 43880) TaxID=246409 RepID=I1BU62_RHIO9|nr:hypothetical protein RO3G_04447 [Rhizopus delemar RA 99-880]|eukprot:EIE79742.1 hypothetical protein RO3G_04447 [Rhizopus delemar RA 99-880]
MSDEGIDSALINALSTNFYLSRYKLISFAFKLETRLRFDEQATVVALRHCRLV